MHSLSMRAITFIAVIVAISFSLTIFNFAITALVLNSAGVLASIYYLIDKNASGASVVSQSSQLDVNCMNN